MENNELVYLPAREILQLYCERQLSPVEMLQAQINQIERYNDQVNCIVQEHFEAAMSAAKESEQRYQQGRQRPLEGITCAIKDDAQVKGWRDSWGSLLMKDVEPARFDAPIIDLLRQTGAIMHIQTPAPEFFLAGVTWSHLWGATRNPWNMQYTPGGSSGGSAAALASGFTTLAIGSDMGGSLLKAGDHVVCSVSVFGATIKRLQDFARFGVETSFVSQTDAGAWRAALRPTTKLLFAETPTNPLTEVCDIAALADIAHRGGALLAVDNCLCSPALQQPVKLGADLVVHSGTKNLDGQGRVIAGAVCGPADLIDARLVPVMRSAGMSLSPFNAWVVLKGIETLSVRLQAQSERALQLARWLEAQPAVERVYHPALPSHPQHALAMSQQSGCGGAVVSFIVRGGRAGACSGAGHPLFPGARRTD